MPCASLSASRVTGCTSSKNVVGCWPWLDKARRSTYSALITPKEDMEPSDRKPHPPAGEPWTDALVYELLRENRSILSNLRLAEEKLREVKIELARAEDGRLELVIKLADADREIQRLGIHLVASQKDVRQLTSDLETSHLHASSIQLSMEHFRRLFEGSSEAFLLHDGEHFTYCNEAAASLLGATDRAMIHGHTLAELSPTQQPNGQLSADLASDYMAIAPQAGKLDFEWVFCRQDNHQEVATEIVLTVLLSGGPSTLLMSVRDATERQVQAQKMAGMAFLDALTGLPNRRLLSDRLTQAIAHAKRNGKHGAIVFLDLDHFKQLNDQYGHACGDDVLRQAAARIQDCIRAEDTVSRIGGDEFVVLMVELDADAALAQHHAKQVAEKIRTVLAQPYTLLPDCSNGQAEHVLFHCPASLGVVLFNGLETDAGCLLKEADKAMYRAKSAGGNRVENAMGISPHERI